MSVRVASSREPLKVAVIGCGKIADGHIEEIQKMPERARVVAACDRELLLAEQICTRYEVPRPYDRFDEMLARERPDVVHITAPPAVHAPLARTAIDAGCHVFVEKPFALSYDEARSLLAYAESRDRVVTVGYASYFEPPALAMRELVARGVLGDPVHVESFYGYNLDGPFGSALLADSTHWVHRLPGKLLQNIIDHMLNKVAEFVQDDRPEISAFGSVLRARRFGDDRDRLLDELRVLVRGARVSGYATFSSAIRPAGQFVRVYGTRGTLHVDYVMRTVTIEASPTLPSAIGRLVPAFEQGASYLREGARNVIRFARSDFHYFAGMQTLIGRYYDSIVTGAAPPIAYRDILRVAKMMDDIFAQVPQGGAS